MRSPHLLLKGLRVEHLRRAAVFAFNQGDAYRLQLPCALLLRADEVADVSAVVGGSDGWLNVKREGSDTVIALPEYLRVEHRASQNGRDHFSPLEGIEKGRLLSVRSGHLRSGLPGYHAAAMLTFHVRKERLSYAGLEVKAITHPRNPIAEGTHPVQIPDFPHAAGGGYSSVSQYAKSWFYLGHGHAMPGNNDRYLHPGSISAGCITVDPGAWTALYRYLILCRRGDGQTVGTVTVIR